MIISASQWGEAIPEIQDERPAGKGRNQTSPPAAGVSALEPEADILQGQNQSELPYISPDCGIDASAMSLMIACLPARATPAL